MAGDFRNQDWSCRMNSFRAGPKGQSDSCAIIIFKSVFLSEMKLDFESNYNSTAVRLIQKSDFTPELVDLNYWKSESFPDWYKQLKTMNVNKTSTYNAEQIIEYFDLDEKISSNEDENVEFEEEKVGSEQQTADFDKDSQSVDNESVDNESVDNESVDNDDSQSFVFGDPNILNRRKRGFKFSNWEITDAAIASMVVLSSLGLESVGGKYDEQLESKILGKGSVIEINDPLQRQATDKLCSLHDEKEYEAEEVKLVGEAQAVVELITKITDQCQSNMFPIALGQDNLTKFCRIFYPKATCLYTDEIAKSLGCMTLAHKWTKNEVQMLIRIHLPLLNDEGYFGADNVYQIPLPKQFEAKYYKIDTMPIYSMGGYLKSQLDIPNDLIMSVYEDGGSRLFTGCQQSEESERLYNCQSADNIPIGISDCVISQYNNETSSCPCKLYFKFMNLKMYLDKYSITIKPDCQLKKSFPAIFYSSNVNAINGEHHKVVERRYQTRKNIMYFNLIFLFRNPALFYKKSVDENLQLPAGNLHIVNDVHAKHRTVLFDCLNLEHGLTTRSEKMYKKVKIM